MTTDFFKKNDFGARVDWNFNLLFDDENLNKFAKYYREKLVDFAELYPMQPDESLHCTIARIGIESDFRESEMLVAADKIARKLVNWNAQNEKILVSPPFLWFGVIFSHLSPDEKLREIFDSVREVISFPGDDHFFPHITLAYNRDNSNEEKTYDKLMKISPIPCKIARAKLVLERQTQNRELGRYEHEIVREIMTF